MANKKQQIILTHGSTVPSGDVLTNMALGEVLVQHAEKAEDTALHTKLSGGTLVSFPSKAYVDNAIANVDASGTASKIEALETSVDNLDKAYKDADTQIRTDFTSADAQIRTDFANADTQIRADFASADTQINASITALDGRVENLENEVSDNLNTATAYTDTRVSELENGQVATNKNAIDVITGDTNTAGSIKNEVAKETTAREQAIGGLQEQVDLKVNTSEYSGKISEIEGDIDALESVLSGYTSEGSVQNAINSKVDTSVYNAKISEIEGEISAIDSSIDNLGNTYYNKTEVDGIKTNLEGAITEAKTTLTEATGVTAGVKVVKDNSNPNNYTISAVGLASESSVSTLEGRIDVIEGDNAGKSMAEIAISAATEEVARIVAEAPADFDTLKEIADWISSDTSGATATQTAVSQLREVTSGYTGVNAIKTEVSGIESRVETAEGKITELETFKNTTVPETYATKAELSDGTSAIDAKFGTGITSANTVTNVINAETSAREQAIGGLQSQIDNLGNTYYDKTEVDGIKTNLEGAITEAKTTLTEATGVTAGVKVVKDNSNPNNYTISAVGLASESSVSTLTNRVDTAEGKITELETFKNTTVPETYATKAELSGETSARTQAIATVNENIAKKADATVVDTLSGRVDVIEETYVQEITYLDADGVKQTLSGKTIDLSGIVIDGGEY